MIVTTDLKTDDKPSGHFKHLVNQLNNMSSPPDVLTLMTLKILFHLNAVTMMNFRM